MTSRVAATRYARALFDVALAEGQDLDQIGRELSETVALVSGNGELARALTHAGDSGGTEAGGRGGAVVAQLRQCAAGAHAAAARGSRSSRAAAATSPTRSARGSWITSRWCVPR